MYRLVAVLLLSTFALAQATAPSTKTSPAKQPAAQSSKPAPSAPAAKPAEPKAEEKKEVPATAAVITIAGVCDGKVPATPPPDCKTVITRASFEKLVDALDPKMPAPRRQQLADVYARMLVMSDAAEQRGITNSPEIQEVLRFTRMQALTQLLLRELQKEAEKVPPAETEKYYNEHAQQFEQATLHRIFIPRTPPGGEKPPDDKTFQAEGDKIRAAAAAGGDLEKLQKQAYDDLGVTTPPPPTSAGTLRRQSLPPGQGKVFDLQPGQVSEVLSEPGGLYIFKLESKKKLPLPEVTPEIERTLREERLKDSVDKITKNVKPVLNQDYFAASAEPGPPAAPSAPSAPSGPPRRRPAPPALGPPTGAPSTPPASAPSTPPPPKPPGQ